MKDPDASRPAGDRVLLHAGYPLWRKHTLVTFARAKELQDEGHDVAVTCCSATAGTCAVNLSGSPVLCAVCRSRVRRTAAANGIPLIPLRPERGPAELDYSDRRQIAEGVHSTTISTFRQLPGDGAENPILRRIKRRYYRTACGLLQAVRDVLEQRAVDRVEVFNGRHACTKFLLVAARRMGIPFSTLEVTGQARPILFRGHTAHDRTAIQKRIRGLPLDMDAAADYFERRRRPSVNRFTKRYADDFEPPAADGFRKRVAVFLSSQDEFEALGREWKSPFSDYARVIHTACQASPDYLFCVRFHPNQADMISDVIGPFDAVRQLPNAIVYEPTDSANSYTLIRWSDLVVTFGSMVTVEACWSGKPAIMLGPSFYDQLDVSHNPSTMEEFLSLLRQDLKPRPRENAARLARYLETECDEMIYVGHNGRRMVADGIVLKGVVPAWLSRVSDMVFCHAVKAYAKWFVRRRLKRRVAHPSGSGTPPAAVPLPVIPLRQDGSSETSVRPGRSEEVA